MSWFFKSKSKKNEENGIITEAESANEEPVEILNKLLSIMNYKTTVAQSVDETNNIILNISTDEAGRLIGEKGETLYALQYIVNKIIYSRNTENPKVIIDVDGYRSKRKDKLIDMAQRAAEATKNSGKNSSLPLLNSYERKIVHESLHDDDEVITQSEGEGYYKKISVSLKK